MFPLPHLKSLHLVLCGLVLATPVWAFEYLQPLPAQVPVPADNLQTPAKIALGKKLFFDPLLLGPRSTISCQHCHNPAQGGDDGRALSIGQNNQTSRRSSPTLWNIGFQTVLYWDGRLDSLEGQTLDHLRDPVVSTWPNLGSLVDKLTASPDYRDAFALAFPKEPIISAPNIARAIASFERTLLAVDSPFDRYLAGDKSAISAAAQRGIQAFNDAGCLACHFGANFAGPAPGPALKMGDGFYELFPNNLGSAYDARYRLADDPGRYRDSGIPDERYMWRVPPLRNIALTAPYFHNGAVSSLEEAIRVMGKTQFGKELSEDAVNDIAAFLRSLTGKAPAIEE
jgi:cytochrome c peroxidase